MHRIRSLLALAPWALLASPWPAAAQGVDIDALVAQEEPKVIAWRRDFHQYPELSNREVRTSGIVAAHLKSLGLPVRTGVAKHGVVALLKGGMPGPTIALRADMDALPVTELTDVPFRSTVKSEYRGETVGVMHACGHDAHTAILLGIADILVSQREKLAGNVLFIFQPAEEGAPPGEQGGASLMLQEGLFAEYQPVAVFGLHVHSMLPAGLIGFRPGPLMAASDAYRIVVTGRETHGGRPWNGVDPIVVSAQIIDALQAIVARQVDITKNPAVVSVGSIRGGVRNNIIPDSVEMLGTIRTFDGAQRQDIFDRIARTVTNIAAASGATAVFEPLPGNNPVTRNDPALTERVTPSLERAVGPQNVRRVGLHTGAEDFAYFAEAVPGFYFFVGITPPGANPAEVAENHSPLFHVDEDGLAVGMRAMTALVFDFLSPGAQ
jgi:amidohydrolase